MAQKCSAREETRQLENLDFYIACCTVSVVVAGANDPVDREPIMSWMSYLPNSPERLSTIEGWLYFAIFLFGVLTAVSGYVVVQVRGHRAGIETKVVEDDLSATKRALKEAQKKAAETELTFRGELDKANKKAEALEAHRAPRDVPSEKREAVLSSFRRVKGKV